MGKYEDTPQVLKKRLIVSYIYRMNFSNCAPIFLPSPPLPTGTLLNKPALAYFCMWPTEFNSFGGRLFTGAEATMGSYTHSRKLPLLPSLIASSSPGKGGASWALPVCHQMLLGPVLGRFCADCHSSHEFLGVTVVPCPVDNIWPCPSPASGSTSLPPLLP